MKSSCRSASSTTLAWARRNSSQISTTRSAVFSAISLRLSPICSAIDLASSSRTLSLVSLDFISVATIGSTPWRKSQMSLAMSTMPTPLATTETRRPRIEPTRRWPMREAMLASWRRTTSTTVPAMPSLPSISTWPVDTWAPPLPGSIAVFLAGAVGDDAGDGRAVAAAEKGLHALRRRAGRIDGGELDALADLLAEPGRQGLDGLLHRLRAVDPLGGRGGKLLRLLARGQRRPQLEPARLLAHLADGAVDLAVDDVVDVPAPPLVGDQRLVVDIGKAGLEALAGDRLDGGAEAVLVAGLAGFVFGARHGRGGTRGRDLCEDERGCCQAGDGGTERGAGLCSRACSASTSRCPRHRRQIDMGIAARNAQV